MESETFEVSCDNLDLLAPKVHSTTQWRCDEAIQVDIDCVEDQQSNMQPVTADEYSQTYPYSAMNHIIKSSKELNTLTGIHSFELLKAIEKCLIDLENAVVPKVQSSLSAYQRILMTFMILKMKMSYSEIAIFFETTSTTVKKFLRKRF